MPARRFLMVISDDFVSALFPIDAVDAYSADLHFAMPHFAQLPAASSAAK